MIRSVAALAASLFLAIAGIASARDKPEADNMRLVGYNDLQGRSACQPSMHQQFGRRIAYIGHHGGTMTCRSRSTL